MNSLAFTKEPSDILDERVDSSPLLVQRLESWQHAAAVVLEYAKHRYNSQHATTQQLAKQRKIASNLPSFSGTSVQQVAGGSRQVSGASVTPSIPASAQTAISQAFVTLSQSTESLFQESESNEQSIKQSVIPNLELLLSDLDKHIKTLSSQGNRGLKEVERQREQTMKYLEAYEKSLTTAAQLSNKPDPKTDPYALHRRVRSASAEQILRENSFAESNLNVQHNFQSLERHIIGVLQNSITTLNELAQRFYSAGSRGSSSTEAAFTAVQPDDEWSQFTTANAARLVPERGYQRDPANVSFANSEHESSKPLMEGSLSRKGTVLKGNKPGYYVLTSAGFLHQFKSGDVIEDSTPEMSLFIPESELGGIPANNLGDLTFKIASRDYKKAFSTRHRYTFTATSYDELQAWFLALSRVAGATGSAIDGDDESDEVPVAAAAPVVAAAPVGETARSASNGPAGVSKSAGSTGLVSAMPATAGSPSTTATLPGTIGEFSPVSEHPPAVGIPTSAASAPGTQLVGAPREFYQEQPSQKSSHAYAALVRDDSIPALSDNLVQTPYDHNSAAGISRDIDVLGASTTTGAPGAAVTETAAPAGLAASAFASPNSKLARNVSVRDSPVTPHSNRDSRVPTYQISPNKVNTLASDHVDGLGSGGSFGGIPVGSKAEHEAQENIQREAELGTLDAQGRYVGSNFDRPHQGYRHDPSVGLHGAHFTQPSAVEEANPDISRPYDTHKIDASPATPAVEPQNGPTHPVVATSGILGNEFDDLKAKDVKYSTPDPKEVPDIANSKTNPLLTESFADKIKPKDVEYSTPNPAEVPDIAVSKKNPLVGSTAEYPETFVDKIKPKDVEYSKPNPSEVPYIAASKKNPLLGSTAEYPETFVDKIKPKDVQYSTPNPSEVPDIAVSKKNPLLGSSAEYPETFADKIKPKDVEYSTPNPAEVPDMAVSKKNPLVGSTAEYPETFVDKIKGKDVEYSTPSPAQVPDIAVSQKNPLLGSTAEYPETFVDKIKAKDVEYSKPNPAEVPEIAASQKNPLLGSTTTYGVNEFDKVQAKDVEYSTPNPAEVPDIASGQKNPLLGSTTTYNTTTTTTTTTGSDLNSTRGHAHTHSFDQVKRDTSSPLDPLSGRSDIGATPGTVHPASTTTASTHDNSIVGAVTAGTAATSAAGATQAQNFGNTLNTYGTGAKNVGQDELAKAEKIAQDSKTSLEQGIKKDVPGANEASQIETYGKDVQSGEAEKDLEAEAHKHANGKSKSGIKKLASIFHPK